MRQKTYVKFNQGNIADTFSAKEIAKKFGKNAKDVNLALLNLGFIKKCDNGYNVTDVGKYYGGKQNFYMGKASVRWDERIVYNENFVDEIMKNTAKTAKEEQKEDFREKFKAEYRTNDGHYVRSRAELVIANWLFAEGIAYAYEKRVPIKEDIYCDFYIPNVKRAFKIWCEFKFVEKRGERPCDYFKVWMYSATALMSSSLIGVAIGFIIAPRPNLFAPVL